ncbi:penicillin-binding protein, transpeptidase domain protein [Aeromicrobium marinum DSM 15272]|uniref:Penicillin-binding protein, transpeptidase domain protein n=1 Tax=Aeromicrobium marinum DSM 15272 TaxID=585531 RepID=E2S971_9ACTN|nr:penicillin-binding protein 2 [Aeromicrobium marinum]EFQ84341.1 penicillin-binding protein, transpeptidase domain protein [Aeromicrobium marinum DSM 15272]
MTRRQVLTRRRLRFGLVVIMVMFAVFGVRLLQIQGFDTSAYAAMASDAGTRSTLVPAERGEILDRNGVPLASSVSGLTLTADPQLTAENAPEIASILREQLGDQIDYFATIDQLRTPDSRFVYLVKDIPAWSAEQALTALREAGLAGVFSEKESLRTYPAGSLAANLLGYLNDEGNGVAGLEQQYQDRLAGTDGTSTDVVSPTGQRIPLADSDVVAMVPGEDVVTTIDRDLQWYADQRLAEAVQGAGADWGLAVTMDVRTCEIVQLSQVPTFDADTRSDMNDSRTVARSLQTVYEPGSVMKTITMAALADQGKIAPETPIVVPGGMVIDNFPIGDYWEHGTLQLTAAGVVAKSSNLGTIVAAQQMDDATMHDYLTRFGFGQPSGVDLPGESAGILADHAGWTRANHATISFGQGISVTAMQVVRAVGAIANAGSICEPTVVAGFQDAEGHRTDAPVDEPRQIISTEAARQVTRMMEAVTADDGTAPAAQIPGYRVAGKTGTAWRVDPATGRYIRGQNTVSFVGFAPADAPRFLTYIVLDRPHSNAGGGSTAAPVFHDIMSMALERFGVVPTGAPSPVVPQEW